MYGDAQPSNVINQFGVDEEDATACGEPIDNAQVPYEAHILEELHPDAIYDDVGSHIAVHRSDPTNQLTLSFRGQVYVFDSVTTDKVQAVLLLLGGSEAAQGAELAYQNERDLMDYSMCSQPHRATSLSRFRQKRKERCFDKKIRYNVRQEVARRMQCKKGQFASSKKSEESFSWNSAEDTGQDDSLLETICTHCCTSSKSTPMMQQGPAGPRTLCNTCGLFWANKGTLRDLSKIMHDNALIPSEQGEG